MRPKHIFAILLLCSIGLVGVLFFRAMPQQTVSAAPAPPPPRPVPREEILVAVRPLPSGLLVRTQDVAWRERREPAQGGDIVRPSAETRQAKPESDDAARAVVYGAAVRAPIGDGEPVRLGGLVKPGDREFLPAVLTQGNRALTIPVSAASGGTGLMFAGDHVDVMLTQTFKNDDAPLTRRSVSETVVEGLRVLAIDRNPKPQPGVAAHVMVVTLEVATQQAEKINVAQELGKLSLTLRSVNEPAPAPGPVVAGERGAPAPLPSPPAPPPAPTWAGDVSPALKSAVPPAKVIQAEKPSIKVMRGNNSIETKAQ
jgi:pilus assembly protein CpaB